MFATKLKGALAIITNSLFYDNDGNVSLIKVALLAAAAWYFVFLNPPMLLAIFELFLIGYVASLLFKIGKALLSGKLDSYAKTATTV